MCQNYYLITGDAADLDQLHGNPLVLEGASAAAISLSSATIASNLLVSTELSSFAKKVVAKDNVLDIYLHTSGATVTVGGGSLGSQQIKPLSISEDLQRFIRDSLNRLDSLIDLDFRFTTSKDTADLNFFVDSTISLGGTGTTLGIALSNSSAGRNWWEIALNGPPLANQPDYLRYATIHEFGHILGLEHPFDNSDGDYYASTNSGASAFPEDTVMAYRDPQNGSWPIWYSQNDILALQSIWGVEESPIAVAQEPKTLNSIPVYRLFNRNSSAHFYTSSLAEKDSLIGNLFNYEGVAYSAPVAGDQLLHRFHISRTGSHFYTASSIEKDNIISNPAWGYSYEGISHNVYADARANLGVAPVYRLYNTMSTQHLLTASLVERDFVISTLANWNNEGVAFYV